MPEAIDPPALSALLAGLQQDSFDYFVHEVNDKNGPFYQCSSAAEDSSWHGTQTSALIAALTNNGVGMASVARTVRVLPIRVLGKCGGYDSDILAGMLWAVGQTVPGVPVNPTPARVLNLSGSGTQHSGESIRTRYSVLRSPSDPRKAASSRATSAGGGTSPAKCRASLVQTWRAVAGCPAR